MQHGKLAQFVLASIERHELPSMYSLAYFDSMSFGRETFDQQTFCQQLIVRQSPFKQNVCRPDVFRTNVFDKKARDPPCLCIELETFNCNN